MLAAVIDIGSNTVRLSVYEATAANREGELGCSEPCGSVLYRRLFGKKLNVGLAAYVDEHECLTDEGVACAVDALRELRGILECVSVDVTGAFATASLRNIANSAEARAAVEQASGFTVQLISEQEEALLGYEAVRCECAGACGAVIDVGGGSTEITLLEDDIPVQAVSLPVGSLKLFRTEVAGLLPTVDEQERIRRRVAGKLDKAGFKAGLRCGTVCGVGGTARAVYKLLNRHLGLSAANRMLTSEQLDMLVQLMCQGGAQARDLMLRSCPDRVHTIVPGLLALQTVTRRLGMERLQVSDAGVREGYLLQHVLRQGCR